MKGYLKVAPEDVYDTDGFFPTGDAGFVDENGMLHWTGRSDDMIKTGGANVSPVEVEEVLLRHPTSLHRSWSAYRMRRTERSWSCSQRHAKAAGSSRAASRSG